MKRFLAVLLCLLMCVSMLPVAAFAEDADIVNENNEGDVGEQRCAHDNITYVPGEEPGCKGGHIEYYKCGACGKLFSDAYGGEEISAESTQLLPKHIKPADEKLIKIIPATCTEKGQVKYKCANCGHDVTDYQKELGHQLTIHPYVTQTCTTDGNYTYYSCDRCGKLYWNEQAEYSINQSDTVIPKGHNLTHVEAVAPTCTAEGNIEYYSCNVCGKLFADETAAEEITRSVVLQALGHNIFKVEEKAPTCAEAGNYEHWKCANCGMLFSDAEGAVITTAEAVTIGVLPHTLEKIEALAADCDTDGNIEYWKCSECGKCFQNETSANEIEASDTIIGKFGHYLEEVAAKPACLEEGNIQYWVCKRDGCGKLFSDAGGTTEIQRADTVVPEIGHHDFDGGVCKVCRAEDPDYEGPSFKDTDLRIAAGEGLVVRIDADFDTTMSKNWSIAIDGETISKDFIDVTRGSTVFHIDSSALSSLAPGTYTITITIDGEQVTGQLVVEDSYTVTFDTNGHGTAPDNQTVKSGEKVTRPANPKADGYRFDGWYNEAACTSAFSFDTLIESNTTIYAKWTQLFKVTYDPVIPVEVIYTKEQIVGSGEKATKQTDPKDSAQHHTFSGWYKDKEYSTKFDFDKEIISKDITLYAKWSHDYPHDKKDILEGKGICPYCWEADHSFKTDVLDPAFSAEIVRGNGKTAHYGSYFPMIVNTYYRYVKDSVGVKVDGKTLNSEQYKVFSPKSGTSTVVELDRAYIRQLPVGKYAISIKTDLGTARGFFWVSSSPKTGDDSNVALYVTVGVISAAGVAGIAYYLLKKRKK